jgi:hypothetical protein
MQTGQVARAALRSTLAWLRPSTITWPHVEQAACHQPVKSLSPGSRHSSQLGSNASTSASLEQSFPKASLTVYSLEHAFE